MIKRLDPQKERELVEDKTVQKYSWVNEMDHKGNFFDVIALKGDY